MRRRAVLSTVAAAASGRFRARCRRAKKSRRRSAAPPYGRCFQVAHECGRAFPERFASTRISARPSPWP